jgi:hypothetical protein
MRWVIAVVVTLALSVGSACSSAVPASYPTGGTNSTASAASSITPSTVAVRLTTRQVCTVAMKATTDVAKLYNVQLSIIERAVARGDTATMLAAAEAINEKFTEVAATLAALVAQPINLAVKAKIAQAASALTEMSSQSYTGSVSDIKKRLGELADSVNRVCS